MMKSEFEERFKKEYLETSPLKKYKWIREYEFLKDRQFRFDFANVRNKIAIEIQGGIWRRGRHNTGYGIAKDTEKHNLAILNGWKIFYITDYYIKKYQESITEHLFTLLKGKQNE